SSRRRHTRFSRDWSSDVCSSDLTPTILVNADPAYLGAPHRPTVALHSDARLGLEALAAELGETRSMWITEDVNRIRTRCAAQIAELGEISEWVGALRDGMADDDILVG